MTSDGKLLLLLSGVLSVSVYLDLLVKLVLCEKLYHACEHGTRVHASHARPMFRTQIKVVTVLLLPLKFKIDPF